TPTPTVPFPQENDESSSSVTAASSNPVQYYEQQDHLPLHFVSCTPSPTISVPEQNVDSSSSVVRHFAPCDLLPIPKVPQRGQRMLKSNKRLASARNLTSNHELQKSKEAYEEKLRKETKKQEAALKKANNQAKNKEPIVRKTKPKKKADKEDIDVQDNEEIFCLRNDNEYLPPQRTTPQPKRQRISRVAESKLISQ
ncbi:Uncharacterized protein APZ42_004233, partial [Daphnia magna]